ncbi:16S rRNA (uracil(1498)-N(3))-methyltransferase [[Clostridium] spiroforme]|nr:16S rRNA (uracil(1498)-N(3))-methyltransferase [Thomasclavelia spiroformis]
MQKYFIDGQLTIHQQFQINETDHHHIKNVMRNHDGDQIICIDTMQQPYLCSIENVNEGKIKVMEALDINNELDVEVTLIYALPKGDKFELVLQKACELGVSRIIPLQSRRCVVKMTKEKMTKKLPRYQKILKEASEQSGRNRIPDIENVITVKDISSYLGDVNLVAYEETAKQNRHGQLYESLSHVKQGDKIVIIVGSEGGFDKDEIAMMNEAGVKCCSLGKRILRSETAPLYMLSVIGYVREVAKC